MDGLKQISHTKFNVFIEDRGSKERNDYSLKEMKAVFNPLKVDRKALVVSLQDKEPTEFHSMMEASFGIGERVIRYARNNGRDFLRNSRAKTSRCFS